MAKEKLADKKARSIRVIETLIKEQEDARCTLDYESDWQLLFAGILSAQCTDERVNIITGEMFNKWANLEDYAKAELIEVEEAIRSCGLYRNKAKAIKGSAELLLENFAGRVPNSREELLKLPGVGQKIANLLLGELFQLPQIVVDTHCGRISQLLGFTSAKDPLKIEADLEKILPSEYWIVYGHHMVDLGRRVCKARCRQCALCPVLADCAYAGKRRDKIENDLALGIRDECY